MATGRFAPLGRRGMFTSRQYYGVPDYVHRGNDETLLVVLIEDIVAIGNLNAILEVEGIDVFFVAPSDLAASMGHIGDWGHPSVQAKIADAIQRIVAAGRHAGTLVTNEDAATFATLGARFLMTGVRSWLEAGATAFVSSARS